MKYKIFLDPEKKILKAIAKDRWVPSEFSDKDIKKLNGGKVPKFPKNMPPSGSVWGVVRIFRTLVAYVIPKPITEIGPKEGRITGRYSNGNPIYGGYYVAHQRIKESGVTQEDINGFINSEQFKEIDEKYKEKGLEVLSKNPVVVNIATGKVVNTKPKTEAKPETEPKQKPTDTKHSKDYKRNLKILRDMPKGWKFATGPNTTKRLDKLTKNGRLQHRKIENDPYMSLSINKIGTFCGFPVYSIAHYGVQNGDLMADPEVNLIRIKSKNGIFYLPTYFRNDYIGVARRYFSDDDEKPMTMNKAGIADLVHFMNQWTSNLIHQGFI